MILFFNDNEQLIIEHDSSRDKDLRRENPCSFYLRDEELLPIMTLSVKDELCSSSYH